MSQGIVAGSCLSYWFLLHLHPIMLKRHVVLPYPPGSCSLACAVKGLLAIIDILWILKTNAVPIPNLQFGTDDLVT